MNRTVAGGGTVVAASAHVTYAAAREGAARGGGVRLPGRRGAHLAYGVANARLGMLTRQVAQEAGQAGVRIDCIAPSAIGSHSAGPTGRPRCRIRSPPCTPRVG